jgi:endonuclease/exonuclease/phosphatase (EEP) superfamily protein YafD
MDGRHLTMKTIQVNLGRGKAAMALLQTKIQEEKVDVLMIQEPFHTLGNWANAQTFGGREKTKVLTVIRNSSWKATLMSEFTTDRCITVKLEGNLTNMLLVNCYIEGTNALDATLDLITRALAAHNGLVLIGGDFNSKNPVWGATSPTLEAHIF